MISIFKNKYSHIIVFLIVVVIGVFAIGENAHADFSDKIISGFAWIIYGIIYTIGKVLTLLAGWLVQIASWNEFINVSTVVTGWVVLRDLCNMFFVLFLLVIAFGAILRLESYSIKKLLPKLLIMAVLINFSRTICGIIIDFSQVIMLTFAAGLNANNLVDSLGMGKMMVLEGESIDGAIEDAKEANHLGLSTVAGLLAGLVAALIAFVVVLVAIAVLVMRMIFLWVYIILSPIAFLTAVLPQTKSYASRWWSEFMQQVAAGPILLFFIWLAFATASADAVKLDATTGNEFLQKGVVSGFFASSVFIKYLITIGLLIAGLLETQKMGGAIGSMAGKGMAAVSKGKGFAIGGVKKGIQGGAKAVGRGALGVGSAVLAGKHSPLKKVDSMNKLGKFAGKWKGDLVKSRAGAKKAKRLKMFKAMGMGEDSFDAMKDVADSKLGRNTKTVVGAAATTYSAVKLAAVNPVSAAVIGFVGAATVANHYRRKKGRDNYDKTKNERDERMKASEAIRNDESRLYADKRDGDVMELDEKNKENEKKLDKEKEKLIDDKKAGEISKNEYNLEMRNIDNKKEKLEKDYNSKLADIDNKHKINTQSAEDRHQERIKNDIDGKKMTVNKNDIRINRAFAKEKIEKELEVKIKSIEADPKIKEIDKRAQIDKLKAGAINQTAEIDNHYDQKIKNLENPFNKWKDHHPNKVTMEATKEGNKEVETARGRVGALSGGQNITDFSKGSLYSASGQTGTQKKFFDQLTATNEKSAKAIGAMVDTLKTVQSKGGNASKPEKEMVQELKQGISAYKKGGGNTGNLSDVINIIDTIQTGDGSNKKHTATVDGFTDMVIPN